MTELETLRHSCAHVLATAILSIWPEAQFAAGPPTKHGFYYDVDLPHRITPEDFPQIEEAMTQILKAAQPFERSLISREEALELGRKGRLASLGERPTPSHFKIDILERIPEGEEISLYQNGDFIDLCAGPHVPKTSKIGAFRLTHVASAYYRGDEKNPQLQRIYGTAFATKKELRHSLELLEEAKKRDHRKLGKELQLFHIDEMVGPGLILWTPKGAIVRDELQKFISESLRKQHYQQVVTPHIADLNLFRTSGHFPYYAESQFPPLMEKETIAALAEQGCSCGELSNRLSEGNIEGYLLKPMNCPMHARIFASQPHSYRDLPVRLAEFGTVYRWEQSGELNGMSRVRGFTQDDAHIFCQEDQISSEIAGCLQLIDMIFSTFAFHDYRVRIGLRDPSSTKYVGSDSNWEKAEQACRQAAKQLQASVTEEEGEAAFYGPKIDFVVNDVLGREWQLGTIQVDFNLPERFNLHYTGADGKEHRPVMIHRAPFGSMERFTGILIEHLAGAFPVWLAPEQARILPISEHTHPYAKKLLGALREQGIRAEADLSSEKIGAKIRLARLAKIPHILVVGAREEETKSIALRSRQFGDEGSVSVDDFLNRIEKEVHERIMTTPLSSSSNKK